MGLLEINHHELDHYNQSKRAKADGARTSADFCESAGVEIGPRPCRDLTPAARKKWSKSYKSDGNLSNLTQRKHREESSWLAITSTLVPTGI